VGERGGSREGGHFIYDVEGADLILQSEYMLDVVFRLRDDRAAVHLSDLVDDGKRPLPTG
jgi:hypothetical protein